MAQEPPSLLRISLLLLASLIAGIFVSALLVSRLEARRANLSTQTEQSLAVESPEINASQ
jgi:hypothetical protein